MKKMLKLRSSDNKILEVEEAVMLQSQTIKHLIEDINRSSNDVIPLDNVNSNILTKIIEYCTKHANDDNNEFSTDEDQKTWGDEFIKVDLKTLFDLIMAANYLEIKSLFDLACQTVANMIRGKTPEEIRETFNIKNDFTPEEEEEIRKENEWAFQL